MKIKCLYLFFAITLLISCETDDEVTPVISTVYLESSFAEIYKINGVEARPYSQTNGTSAISNNIDISSFGNANLSSFNTKLAAPTDNSVSINASLESVVIVLKNGQQVPPFFAGGDVGTILEFVDDPIKKQEFLFDFSYPSNANPIAIADIASINLVYGFDYTDNASGGTIFSRTISHSIVFEGGTGGGGGGGCNQEISSVTYSDIAFGDACGSSTSVRLYYTNSSNISIRVRFTVINESGEWSGQNLAFILDPGETTNQHFCYPKYV